jgi:NAD(P)-dependent dehydrogenase (short-subunit alcohol dehydrogenase family)
VAWHAAPPRLAGRTAIVTGASRGLGKAIALAFAKEGAAVAVVARSETQWNDKLPGTIHETVAEIERAGGRAVAVAADLSKLDDVERAYHESRDALGPIDLLVNNAALTVPGRPPRADDPAPEAKAAKAATIAEARAQHEAKAPRAPFGSFLTFPLSGFERHFAVGVFASYRLMQLVLPDMIDRRRGAIVNISSVAGLRPGEGPYEHAGVPGPIAYGGNKAALHHLTQCVAIEMQAHGIAVNVLSPSEPVITPGNLYAYAAADEAEWASPEDFAEATVRVALYDAGDVTGQLLWDADVLHPELGHRGWLRE